MRKLWIALPVAALVLIGGLFLYVRSAFPPERLRSLAKPRIEAALGRPVDLGKTRLSIIPLVVHLEDVRVLGPDGKTPLLRLGEMVLAPRIVPLLSHALVVRSITISRPEVWIEQHLDGTWNWTLVRPGGTPADEPTPRKSAQQGLALTVDKLKIESGRLHFASEPMHVELEGPLNAELGVRADRALRDVRVEGWVASDSVQGGDRGMLRGLRGLRLRLEPTLRANLVDSSATIDKLRLVLNEAAIEATGMARHLGGKPEIHLETRSESIDLAKLLDALPPGTTGTKGVTASGTVGLDLTIDARPPALPVAHGKIELRDGSVQMTELPERINALTVAIDLAGDSIRVRDLSARFGDAPVHASGLILEPSVPRRTSYDFQIAAQLDLARMSRAVRLPAGTSLAGRADADVRLRGRTARPDSLWIEGPVVLSALDVKTPQLLQPIRGEARLIGAGPIVRIESAHLQAGTSDLALTGTIRPAMPPKQPTLQIQGTSRKLDLAALLPSASQAKTTGAVAGSAPGGKAPGPAATAGQPPLLPVLPPVLIQGTLRAAEVVLQGTTLHDATLELAGSSTGLDVRLASNEVRAADVVLRDARGTLHVAQQAGSGQLHAAQGRLRKLEVTALQGDLTIAGRDVKLENVRGKAYEGALVGRAAVDFADLSKPRYTLELRGEKIDANAFLSGMTPLKGVLTGKLDLQSNMNYLGSDPKLILSSLTGSGQASASAGRIQQLPILTTLAGLFQLTEFKELPYRDLAMHFAVEKGRMQVRDLGIHTTAADLGVDGAIGLDGGLDLALQVKLSEELSKRYMSGKSLANVSSLFADPNGRLLFDFKVGGNYRAPKLQPDLQKTASRAGVSALTENALRRILGGKLPGGLGGVLGGALGSGSNAPTGGATGADSTRPGGSTASAEADQRAAEDAARRAAEDATKLLGGKLGGLLGGGKKSAPKDTTHAAADTTHKR